MNKALIEVIYDYLCKYKDRREFKTELRHFLTDFYYKKSDYKNISINYKHVNKDKEKMIICLIDKHVFTEFFEIDYENLIITNLSF